MIPKIADVRYVSEFKLWLEFEDGREGIIDLENELWGEVFESLRNRREFKKFQMDRELNTIRWGTGADFAPEFLYEKVEVRPKAAL